MFKVLAILARNELLVFLRSKAALFWALVFPILLLTVMLMAFGRLNSVGSVKIEFIHPPGLTQYGDVAHCQTAIRQAFASGDPVQATFSTISGSAVASTVVSTNTVRVLLPSAFSFEQQPLQVQYDFKGPLAVRAAARMIEIAVVRCIAAQRDVVIAKLVHFDHVAGSDKPFDYGQFFVTGILVMVLMSLGVISTALSIASLRERNALKIYACFPIPTLVFLAAIILSRGLMMLISASTLLLVARYGYDIDIALWHPQTLHAVPVVLLGATMLLCVGILLASRNTSVQETELLCHLVYYPALFFGNLTIPLNDAPHWLTDILYVMPINQFVSLLRQVIIDGVALSALWLPLLVMAAWTALLLTMATFLFRWHKN